jgi:hypothetical protein
MLTVCVLLGGCATPATAQPPTTNGFTCRVTADYDGLVFAGSLQRKAGESLTLAVQEPTTLQGLTLSWDGQALTAAIHGISATVDAQKIPQAAVMPLLLNVLDAAAETATDGEKTADGWQLSGEWEGTAYTLVSDPQTGNLISVSVPSVPLTVRFSDFYPLV